MPTPEQFRYLRTRSSDPQRAAHGYTTPAARTLPPTPVVQNLMATGTPGITIQPSVQVGAPATPPADLGGQANAAPQGGTAAPQGGAAAPATTGDATNGTAGGQ